MVFDHTALLAFGAGHRMLSGLVVQAHQAQGRHLFVPALCLAGATAERTALGEHVGALPAMEVVELGYSAALVVGRLVKQGVDWRLVHAVVLDCPEPEWPQGRPVLIDSPKAYAGLGVVTIGIP
ncbi:hypothetical protein [Micromonospora sp. NBC_01412]|uniref:hypothetical protein n=1 Tax=Micromonospora sp. NBC_01412 TaxID=2903590 RepID=UPI0032471B78